MVVELSPGESDESRIAVPGRADQLPENRASLPRAIPPKTFTELPMDIEPALKSAMTIDGALGAALVDYDSGMALGTLGGDHHLDLDVAAAGNTEVVRAELRVMAALGLADDIEDVLITLGQQYHL